MCEFCVSHGEGKKWFHNMRNYSEEVFNSVNSIPDLKKFLRSFYSALKRAPAAAYRWKKRFPRLYKRFVYPSVTAHQKKTHFGQIVTLEEAEYILDNVKTIVRLPCVCRKVTTGKEKRLCLGVGMDLTPVLRDVPYMRDFEHISPDEAKSFIRQLDSEGMIHSVWTFNTPFIGGICNCDRDCMAYRTQITMDIAQVMWRGEAVARIEPINCTGCAECSRVCHFGAIVFDRENNKCSIDLAKCYGCGVCRSACGFGAVEMMDRTSVAETASVW